MPFDRPVDGLQIVRRGWVILRSILFHVVDVCDIVRWERCAIIPFDRPVDGLQYLTVRVEHGVMSVKLVMPKGEDAVYMIPCP